MAITTNGGAGITADAVATLSNKTLEAPVINNASFTGQQSGLQIAFNQAIVFEGTTANDNELTLSAGEPTADRTVTLPNATTTLVGTDTTDTLSNKSISLGSNTVTGTIAQFNTAVTDADFATLAGSETLTNKTLTTPVISTISNTGTLTLPTSTDTLVGRATTDTLTNKTLTSPTIGTQASFDNQAEARFLEATANGVNYVGFKAPSTITSNLVWVLPSADGTANQVLQTNGSGTLSFATSGVSANDQAFAFAVQVFA